MKKENNWIGAFWIVLFFLLNCIVYNKHLEKIDEMNNFIKQYITANAQVDDLNKQMDYIKYQISILKSKVYK